MNDKNILDYIQKTPHKFETGYRLLSNNIFLKALVLKLFSLSISLEIGDLNLLAKLL